MKSYGFLFGAGAELAYNLPTGGQFALDIFRQDPTEPKQEFRDMRDQVDTYAPYATDWLPERYREKNISAFGKSVFESIITSTVEHNRVLVIEKVNDFDTTALKVAGRLGQESVDAAFKHLLGKNVSNIKLSQNIAYNESFKRGNRLFESNYFSALLLVYKKLNTGEFKSVLGNYLLSIMQLQLGALSEDLSHSINDNLFAKKDDGIDLFDSFGRLIEINYNAAGVSGLALLQEQKEFDRTSDLGIVLSFVQKLIEDIYASVLDYKSLIDSNWHNLYSPRADWAKFCKISIFLLTVRKYISELGARAKTSNPNGYYNMLKDAIATGRIKASAIATTNYNSLIQDILEREITYLNGSTSMWYDPYLNKIGSKDELTDEEHHIVVPLIFTQSGTKPMTAITISEKYVDLFRAWKASDAVVVVGFGFSPDDEHINGILRTLVNDEAKDLIIVTKGSNAETIRREKAKALRISDANRIRVIAVDDDGMVNGNSWVDYLEQS